MDRSGFFKDKRFVAALLLASALAASAAFALLAAGGRTAVDRAEVERGDMQDRYTVSGRISFGDPSTVLSEVSGRIAETLVRTNDRVEAGDVLIKVDPSEYIYKRTQAAASAAASAAQLSQARIGRLMSTSPGEYLSGLPDRVSVARSAMENAKRQYETAAALYAEGGISQMELDAAKAACDAAAEQYRSAEASYMKSEEIKGQLEARGIGADSVDGELYRSEEAQLGALIDAQNSAVEQLDELIGKCEIRSPISGTVAQLPLAGVSAIAAGQAAAVIVPDTQDVTVEADILTGIAPYVKEGDAAEIKMDFRGGGRSCGAVVRKVHGYAVESVSPLGLKEYKVHLTLAPDDPSQLASFAGYEADIELTLCSEQDVLTVPSGAVFRADGAYFVYTVESGRAVKTPVEVGYMSPSRTVILSGLSEGDPLVAEAEAEGVFEGAPLRYK